MDDSEKTDEEKDILGNINSKLFKNYGDKARSYERLFYILIAVSLFFLFFLLIPYVFIQYDSQNSIKQLRKSQGMLVPPLISKDASSKSEKGYHQFIQKLLHSPEDLKNFIQNNVTNTGGRATFQSAPCDTNYLSLNLTTCQILTHVDRMFLNYSFNINNNVIGPLFSIYNKTQIKYLQENVLNKPIDTIFLRFNTSSNIPRFYPVNSLASFRNDEIETLRNQDPATYSLYKVFIANDILGQINYLENLFFGNITNHIPLFLENEAESKIVYNNLNDSVYNFAQRNNESALFSSSSLLSNPTIKESFEAGRNLTQTSLTELRKNLQRKLSDVAKELEKFETPFGKIPIEFNTTVTIFPLAIAALFSICSFHLVGAIRVRKEFHFFYKKRDPVKYEVTNKEIQHIAPLWLDPADPNQNKKIFFIILLLPFFIFLVSTGLAFYSWILNNTLEEPPSNPIVYFPLYLLSSLRLGSESPQSIVDDVIYNYINKPVSVSQSDNVGLNIVRAFHIINVTQVLENSGIPPILIAKSQGVPLYGFLRVMINMNYYNQPMFLFLILLMIVPTNLLLSVIAQSILFVFSLIVFLYSYRNIMMEYSNYKKKLKHE